jgi:hypothetical protein
LPAIGIQYINYPGPGMRKCFKAGIDVFLHSISNGDPPLFGSLKPHQVLYAIISAATGPEYQYLFHETFFTGYKVKD